MIFVVFLCWRKRKNPSNVWEAQMEGFLIFEFVVSVSLYGKIKQCGQCK